MTTPPLADFQSPFNGTALIADPIHEYITFTVPFSSPQPGECTEKDLIDSPWMQRLRSIYQLQSARWVYPSAEHSRFQHSLGAMHLAGRFAKHLYPTLAQTVPHLPSLPYIEELLRVTALLHDVGHGPFCHFFEHHYLRDFGLTHEQLGQLIILEHFGPMIRKLRRSPSGPFATGEELDPEYIAFLILKDPHKSSVAYPQWLRHLQPLIGGLFTADNFDYVLRDSYMCGVAVGPVDITRLIHYTLMTPKGLTIHKAGLPALHMFLNARLYLYANVYYHRTTRAIDLHLREIFHDTMKQVFPYNPRTHLEAYQRLTDWALLETVRAWPQSRQPVKQRLGREWARILGREVKWKTAFTTLITFDEIDWSQPSASITALEAAIRRALPSSVKDIPFRVDLASKDPRPLNLLNMGAFQIYVYDPSTNMITKEKLQEFFAYLPARMVQFRVFAHDHHADAELASAAERVLHRLRRHQSRVHAY
ncbi:MAG: HD domain-containing protein [Nitrospirae bacterium]|nr:MAG: HD domain-containing protein [Nitrospirota bacterium]